LLTLSAPTPPLRDPSGLAEKEEDDDTMDGLTSSSSMAAVNTLADSMGGNRLMVDAALPEEGDSTRADMATTATVETASFVVAAAICALSDRLPAACCLLLLLLLRR
jgi:hypothetical protein